MVLYSVIIKQACPIEPYESVLPVHVIRENMYLHRDCDIQSVINGIVQRRLIRINLRKGMCLCSILM